MEGPFVLLSALHSSLPDVTLSRIQGHESAFEGVSSGVRSRDDGLRLCVKRSVHVSDRIGLALTLIVDGPGGRVDSSKAAAGVRDIARGREYTAEQSVHSLNVFGEACHLLSSSCWTIVKECT